jgi:hypothetical protein
MALMMSGCAWFGKGKSAKNTPAPTTSSLAQNSPTGTNVTVTPDASPNGSVARVNTVGRFAVLNFPLGNMPLMGQRLFVYRQGLRVGEVRVTGPSNDDDTVADIINGEAEKGDEIRTQ